jgi:uncharacterized membrane protein HdeD (DUF308 family)
MGRESPVIERAKRLTGWNILAAVLFIVAGLFAIIEPAAAVMGITMLLGWVLIFGGIAHFIATFRADSGRQVLLQILGAIAFVLAGLYILTHPQLAIGTLTSLLAIVIFAVGVFDIITYFRLQREHPSGWMLLNGVVAVLLAILIWIQWPSNSNWAIGTLVGVNLLLTGITRLMFGVAGRRLIRQATA